MAQAYVEVFKVGPEQPLGDRHKCSVNKIESVLAVVLTA